MKRQIIIRADGGTSIGMGHVIRCLALAEMLKNDFEISFAIQAPNETVIKTISEITQFLIKLPLTTNYNAEALHFSSLLKGNEIVILDGYHFKTEYQQIIKKKECTLVVIDDLHSWHHVADVIINHAGEINTSDYSTEKYTQLCLGLSYALLRKEFLNRPFRSKNINKVSKFFISMGAADEQNNTIKFAEALTQLNAVEEIHIMVSSINPHIKEIENSAVVQPRIKIHSNLSANQIIELLQQVDVAICPASSISLEACAVGVGLISGYTAENQLDNLNSLAKHKTLINFGNMNLLSALDVKNKISNLLLSPSIFNELIKNQKKIIDGKSNERLLSVFKKLN